MCKTVHLSAKRFDSSANNFKRLLAEELRKRKIEVVEDYSFDVFNLFRKHKTYAVSLGFDFYRDGGDGIGLTLNENSPLLTNVFVSNISNNIDNSKVGLKWRDIKFVNSYDSEWFKFFNKVSAETKAIFYLCTYNNLSNLNSYNVSIEKMIKIFADEIIRLIRADSNYNDYQKRVKLSKIKNYKNN